MENKKSTMKMELDEVFKKVGEFGKYQRIVYFTLCLVNFPVALNTLGIVFLAATPDHWCQVPQLNNLSLDQDILRNLTIPVELKDGEETYSKCRMYDMNYTGWSSRDVVNHLGTRNFSIMSSKPCKHGWTYDSSVYTSTVVMQWDLVCDNAWLVSLGTSIYMAGFFIGVILFGAIADWIGRRKTLLLNVFIGSIFTVVCAFSPNVYVFFATRFLIGLVSISSYTTAFVIGLELVGPSWRVEAGFMIKVFWTSSYLLTAAFAYFIRDWFMLQLAFSSTFFLCYIFICLIPESPRWLYASNRYIEGDKIIQKAAKLNQKVLPEKLNIAAKSKEECKGNIVDLVRTPKIRARTFNLVFHWFVVSLVYYGLSLNTSSLGGNHYLNFAIAAAVEYPAILVSFLLVRHVGRRMPLSVTFMLGGATLLLTMATPRYMTVFLAMFGKFLTTASFHMIYIYTAELFPTVVRNVGVGVGSSGARFGAIFAPYFILLASTSRFIPVGTFGALSLVAGLCTLLLPETKGQTLPDTIADGEAFGRKVKSPDKEMTSMESGPS